LHCKPPKEQQRYRCMPKQFLIARLLPLTVAVIVCTTLQAQKKYGIVAGAGKSSLYKFLYTPDDFNRYSSSISVWGGVSADIPLIKNKKDFTVFTSLAFARKGYKYVLQNETGTNGTIKDSFFTQKLNYADINLLMVKKFMFGQEEYEDRTNSFFVGTGPVASVFISGNENISMNYFGNSPAAVTKVNTGLKVGDAAGAYKRMYASWQFIAGIEIYNLKLWASASIPLAHYYKDAQKNTEHKLKVFGINAGYTLFTNVKKEKEPKPVPYIPAAADSAKDSDGDGIIDSNDKCPGHKGTAKYMGCPTPDSDGDGINDDDDKCPAVAGTAATNGCPAFADTVKTAVKKDTLRYVIYFEPAKSNIKTEGFNIMTEVVKQLKANSKLVVQFDGHTDNAGDVQANFKRSLERVTVCGAYIESFYIDKKRIILNSYGNTRPVADLKDPLLQWKNRRVEVLVYEK
jgi:outer membrane protein OmpA-like peptidoglycan-associated protein